MLEANQRQPYGAIVPETVTDKDAVTAILGAGATLTGLALVFLGFAASALASYESDTPSSVLAPHRTGIWVLVGALVCGVASIVFLVSWLLSGGEDSWFFPGVALFFIQIIATLLGGGLVATSVLRR